MRSRGVKSPPPARLGGLGEDPAKELAHDAASERDRKPLPRVIVDIGALNGAVEVLDRSPARLGPRQLDEAEVAQHPHVARDGGERQAQLARQRERTCLATLDHRLQNPQTQRMPERLMKGGLEKVVGAHWSETVTTLRPRVTRRNVVTGPSGPHHIIEV